jgi:hypothetical protein
MGTVLLSSPHRIPWYRHFPDGETVWDGWRFLFNDAKGAPYDYLVAFDDLAAPIAPACPRENTIHVATEPPDYLRYDPKFTQQFAIDLTYETEPQHPCAIRSQGGLNWWVGCNPALGSAPGAMSFKALEALFDEPRDKLVSVITSNKTITPGHRLRIAFAQRLKQRFGDRVDFFGRGFVHMTDKLEALRGYRFHVAIENSSVEHYFTEKLSDCLIAGCYPLYYGCPNLTDYLPGDSFSAIDIADFDGSLAIIEAAIDGNFDRQRRDAMREAQRRMMYEHNLFPMLVRLIAAHQRGEHGRPEPAISYGSELLPFRHSRFWRAAHPTTPLTLVQRLNEIADRYPAAAVLRRGYRTAKCRLQ